MTDQLSCSVRSNFPITEVVISGPLSVRSAPAVRAIVLKCLVDQPSSLLVHLADVELVDDMAVLVFSALARHASAWPGCPLVVAAPSAHTRAALDRLAVSRYVEVYSTWSEAYVRATEAPVPRRLTTQLLPVPQAAAEVRRIFTDGCQRWGVPELISRGQLVVTELISNAVEHAGTTIDFKMSLRDRYLHLAVYDRNPAPPRRTSIVSEQAERGRGLLVVDAYAASWGSSPTLDGKVVWATMLSRHAPA
ncbi:MAG TPA: ATP-binding protein [Micromonosporaceae bacterium]|nr:ATP-binding protein [Micromonosporaceae bacterium]